MDLDEEDYEALGYGDERALEALAQLGSKITEAQKIYKAAYMKNRYHTNPEARRKHIEGVRRWELLNRDRLKAWVKIYRKTPVGKAKYKKHYADWYARLKKDPIRWAEYMRKATVRKAKYRAKKKLEAEKAKNNE